MSEPKHIELGHSDPLTPLIGYGLCNIFIVFPCAFVQWPEEIKTAVYVVLYTPPAVLALACVLAMYLYVGRSNLYWKLYWDWREEVMGEVCGEE